MLSRVPSESLYPRRDAASLDMFKLLATMLAEAFDGRLDAEGESHADVA